ncbi:MAG: T9SS type A sorting domain-containing protein [candidate division Zixibacteria bacterium]|nr:T9SS type A sorting domain-containing protein [Candidatus Tariuqbacter arcticus]
MYQNYPNPFNSSTTITFTLNTPEMVKLRIYNTLGQRVAVLLDCQQAAGSYQLKWNGRGADRSPLPSGTYIVRLSTENTNQARIIQLLK